MKYNIVGLLGHEILTSGLPTRPRSFLGKSCLVPTRKRRCQPKELECDCGTPSSSHAVFIEQHEASQEILKL